MYQISSHHMRIIVDSEDSGFVNVNIFFIHHLRRMGVENTIFEDELGYKLGELYHDLVMEFKVCLSAFSQVFISNMSCCFGLR